MNNQHLSKQFDSELNELSAHLLAMGSKVEQQLKLALSALANFDKQIIEEIFMGEQSIDQQEIAIDAECGYIIATRQPAAIDLRFVLAVSKAVAILERAADEVVRIAKNTERIAQNKDNTLVPYQDITQLGEMAASIFHQSLAAFAQLDGEVSQGLIQQDKEINLKFGTLRDKFVASMSTDPHNINLFLDLISIVKAIERIGDYAKKIGDFIVYVVKGTDVRHKKSRG